MSPQRPTPAGEDVHRGGRRLVWTTSPKHERGDLMADLEQHLTEVAAEGEGTLAERLGTPEAYAAELRASAGLPAYEAPDTLPAAERLRRRLRSSPLGTLADTAPIRFVRTFMPELRPAWWVVRGYLAAVVIDAVVFSPSATDGGLPWPRLDGSPVIGTLLVALCIGVSILAGRATTGRERYGLLALAVNVAIVGMFAAVLPQVQDGPSASVRMVDADPFGFVQHGDGAPIRQVCAYDEDGTRLNDVQLFDQNGRPIEFGRGKVDIIMDRIEGGPPGLRRKLDAIVPDLERERFECPKKLKDLQSQGATAERGLIREKLLRDGPRPTSCRSSDVRSSISETDSRMRPRVRLRTRTIVGSSSPPEALSFTAT